MNLNSSIQPYVGKINENTRMKTTTKVYKKTRSLIKSKLNSFRQPFAWAAKYNLIFKYKYNRLYIWIFLRPLFKSSRLTYEIDSESKFVIYKQEENHLSDEDLYKYLSDFKSKEKYLNKLELIGGEIDIILKDLNSDSLSNI